MISAPVSVVVPTYNRAGFLEDAINSAYAQTVRPSEVIVIDDGSTDATEILLRRLEASLPVGFRWRRQAKGGNSSARNAGSDMATGEYVAFLDSDDVWKPVKLERQLQQFWSAPELGLSFTAYNRIEGSSSRLVLLHPEWDPDPNAVLTELLRFCAVGPTSTVMIRRDLLSGFRWDETLRGGEDWQMWLDLALGGVRMGYLPDALVDYRWHGGNSSADQARLDESACEMLDRFLTQSNLPPHVSSRRRQWRAHWHLRAAIHSIQAHDKARARRHILRAARLSPRSVRPGWVRMLGIGPPPR